MIEMQPGSSTANMILYGNDNPYPGTDLGLETSGVSLVRSVSQLCRAKLHVGHCSSECSLNHATVHSTMKKFCTLDTVYTWSGFSFGFLLE